jgi:hypothetical protein
LAKGDEALVGNTGYRRYLKTISQEHFAIDPNKVGRRRSSTASSCCAPIPSLRKVERTGQIGAQGQLRRFARQKTASFFAVGPP